MFSSIALAGAPGSIFPGIRPTASWNFARDQSLRSICGQYTAALVRATSETHFDGSGVMQTAASGVAAYDHHYDAASGLWISDGLSVHLAATNLITNSEDFSAWTAIVGGTTTTVNDRAAPDGTTTMDKLEQIDNESDGEESNVFTLSAGTVYNVSFFCENDDATAGTFTLYDDTGGTNEGWADITWTAGVPSMANGGGGTTAITNIVVEDVGSGRYRVSAAMTSDATNTAHTVRLFPTNGGGGNGLGSWYWGAQVTLGATVQPYIPTTSAAVTRNKDDVQVADINWSEGTFVVTYRAKNSGVAAQTFEMHNNSASDRLAHQIDTSNNHAVFIRDGGATQSDHTFGAAADGETVSAVVAYKLNDVATVAENGTLVADGSATMPTVTTLGIGQKYDEGNTLGGTIAKLDYYEHRHINDLLQQLSA